MGEEGRHGLACVAKHFTICMAQAALEQNLLSGGDSHVTYENVSKISWSDPRLGFVKRAVPKVVNFEEALRKRYIIH